MSGAEGVGSNGAACSHPEVVYNSAASILKDEDVLLIEHQRPWPHSGANGCDAIAENSSASGGSGRCSCCGTATDEYSLFAVFDGHNGVAAARLAADSLLGVLEARLPPGPPPPAASPGFLPWREDVQLAVVESMAELNKMFAMKGILAGCTATLVVQVGWLLTCANLGDSRAILDTGLESHMLTVDHRVATHKGERRRVEAMGNTIAPIDFSGSGPATRVDNGVGPLRIWPGGLCLSRAIGDFDVGSAVIPFPHVMQVMVPPTGARLLVASDGVWDAYEKMNRIGSLLRSWSLDSSPQRLIQSIVRAYGGLRDDTSLIIADLVPPGKSFPECAASVAQRAKAAGSSGSGGGGSIGGGGGGGGGGCGCFGGAPPPPPEPVARSTTTAAAAPAVAQPAKLEVLADVDVAAVMGLMPGANPVVPGWYDEYVGEELFGLAAEAVEAWQEAHERRTGRRPATPTPLESSVRAARAAQEALGIGEAEPLVDANGAAWAPASVASGPMLRTASMFFSGAVAEGEGDYADKFGHYKGFMPDSISSGSPGSSMHSGRGFPAEGSVRQGGYRYGDASVRAGSRFVGDASVRAGSRFVGDASVRAGSAFYGSAGGGGAQQGCVAVGPPQQQQSRNFRADPSIRNGAAFFHSQGMASEGAGVPAQGVPAATAAAADREAADGRQPQQPQEEQQEEGRQHGRRGSSAAASALAAASSGSSGADDASKNASAAPGRSLSSSGGSSGTARSVAPCGSAASDGSKGSSAPIPVPRSVVFGAVTVMGPEQGGGLGALQVTGGSKPPAAASLGESPMDHASMLRQASSGNSSVGYMTTIAEG